MSMLKPKVLPEILRQATTNGIKCVIIVTKEGDLLATTGDQNDKLIGAIVLNIWTSYEKISSDLNCLLLDCELGRLAVAPTSRFLICAWGNTNLELGLLKSKILSLKQYFDEPFNKLFQISK